MSPKSAWHVLLVGWGIGAGVGAVFPSGGNGFSWPGLAASALGGAGAPLWAAGMAGGFFGGALTGGLNGGWQGALYGGLMGGALGGLGGWGFGVAQAHQMAGQYMAGMLIVGAGVAGATNGWDSFAGGFAGGLTGAAVGNGIDSYFNDPLSVRDPDGGVRNEVVEGRGVGTTKGDALKVANETGSRVLYTQSRGVAADIVRGGMQLLFKNSLASRQFAQYMLAHPNTSYSFHSEMTLTALGAAKGIQGSHVGGSFKLVSPFYSKATAENVFNSVGATVNYIPPHLADSAGMFTTLNPVTAPIYGSLGIITLETFHGYETYFPK